MKKIAFTFAAGILIGCQSRVDGTIEVDGGIAISVFKLRITAAKNAMAED